MISKTKSIKLSSIANLQSAHAGAMEFIDLRERKKNPVGQFDRAGRFYLACRGNCCNGIRPPSGKFPMSQMTHGRTATHVACMRDIDATDLRFVSRLIDSDPTYRNLSELQAQMNSGAATQAIDLLLACGNLVKVAGLQTATNSVLGAPEIRIRKIETALA